MITRISTTDSADKLIDELTAEHGELMFHQSGGCCDGSAPMCYTKGEFYLGNADVEIGSTHILPLMLSKELGGNFPWKDRQVCALLFAPEFILMKSGIFLKITL